MTVLQVRKDDDTLVYPRVGSSSRLEVEAARAAAVALYTEGATARTVSGESAAVAWPANVEQAFVGVNVTALVSTPTLTVHIEQQDANDVWHTLASTAGLTAVGTASLHLAHDKVLAGGGSFRIRWEISGGTSPSVTFQVGVQGR